MIHHIPDEWLIELETKLHLASLKHEKLGKRLNKILAGVEQVRQNQVEMRKNDTSIKNKQGWIAKIKLKLANRRID